MNYTPITSHVLQIGQWAEKSFEMRFFRPLGFKSCLVSKRRFAGMSETYDPYLIF